jgi:hypothetical protein
MPVAVFILLARVDQMLTDLVSMIGGFTSLPVQVFPRMVFVTS